MLFVLLVSAASCKSRMDIEGRVQDGDTKEPVSNGEICITLKRYDFSGAHTELFVRKKLDGTGGFRFPDVLPGAFLRGMFCVESPSYYRYRMPVKLSGTRRGSISTHSISLFKELAQPLPAGTLMTEKRIALNDRTEFFLSFAGGRLDFTTNENEADFVLLFTKVDLFSKYPEVMDYGATAAFSCPTGWKYLTGIAALEKGGVSADPDRVAGTSGLANPSTLKFEKEITFKQSSHSILTPFYVIRARDGRHYGAIRFRGTLISWLYGGENENVLRGEFVEQRNSRCSCAGPQ